MDSFFDDYANWTDTTAKYPPMAEAPYLALGVADEIGEFVFAYSEGHASEAVCKEAGDACWYLARYCKQVLKVPFSSAVSASEGMLHQSYSDAVELVGIIAGIEKKRIRDGVDWNPDTYLKKTEGARIAVIKLIAFIADIVNSEGMTLREVLGMNQGKLNDRLEKGTIQGDGDNR